MSSRSLAAIGIVVLIVIVSIAAAYFHILSIPGTQRNLISTHSTITLTPTRTVAGTGAIGENKTTVAVTHISSLTSSAVTTIAITHILTSTGRVGTPIEISAEVAGPVKNVTLVYGLTSGSLQTKVQMQSVANGEYVYTIAANQVTGNISYYIQAYDSTGRGFTTTVYDIAIADFALQPQAAALTVYRTKSATFQLQLLSINNFTEQVQLSTTGNPSGLAVSFSANPTGPGTVNLNVSPNATVPGGTYPITVIATYSPTQSSQVMRYSVIDVTVTDFQVSVESSSYTVYPYSTAVFTVTLTLQKGFVDPVNITDVSGLPQGATYTFTATDRTVLAGVPGTTDITLQIRIPPLTQIGTYPILIVFSGGGITHTIKAQIIVN